MGKGKNVDRALISLTGCMILLVALSPLAHTAPPIIRNPDTLVIAVEDWCKPVTIDPVWAYGVSMNYLQNIYEPLIFYDGERTNMFLPMLSTVVPDINYVPNKWVENITGTGSGLRTDLGYEQNWYWRIYFQIRTGVKFHETAYTLTPSDVEYSLERALVLNPRCGMTWMLYELFFGPGIYSPWYMGNLAIDTEIAIVGQMLDYAVESNCTHVWLNLGSGKPEGPYAPTLHILSQVCFSIISKQWVNDVVIGTYGRPEWSGNWGDYSYDYWLAYTRPPRSPLDDPFPIECGTGPYKLSKWDEEYRYWEAIKFDEYWDGWPASHPAPPYPSFDPYGKHLKPAGYLNRILVTWAYDWPTRYVMFLEGDIDLCEVPPAARAKILGKDGIRCVYPLPELACEAMFYNFWLRWPPFHWTPPPEFNVYPEGEFHEDGIPKDFFRDARIRKAFAHAFNYTLFIEEELLGEAFRPATALVPGLTLRYCPYKPLSPSYAYKTNYTLARELFKSVEALWNIGFTIAIPYVYGSIDETAAEILKYTIESMNPRFHVLCVPLNFNTYYYAIFYWELPMYFMRYHAEYPDVHSMAFEFYHSCGTLAMLQGYDNFEVDKLIELGAYVTDETIRQNIYRQVELMVLEDCPSVPLYQCLLRHYQRDWLNGWYYNPAYPQFGYGIISFYAYPLWKGYYTPHKYLDFTQQPFSQFQPFDVDFNGVVDMTDIGFVCFAYGSNALGEYGQPTKRWNFRCDIDNDRVVDMDDIGYMCQYFGK